MKKIAIISCGVGTGGFSQFGKYLPMAAPGVLYIKKILELAGYDIEMIDQPSLNLTDQNVVDKIKQINPNIVLFNQFFSTRKRIRWIIDQLNTKEIISGVGGHDATFHSQSLGKKSLNKEYGKFDFIVLGECLGNIVQIVENIKKQKSPILLKGEYVENLDSLPIIDHNYPGNIGVLSTSVGCLNDCYFCTTSRFYKCWRARSVASVKEEILKIKLSGKNIIFITDDNFLGNTSKDLERGHQIILACKNTGLKVMIMTYPKQILDLGSLLSLWSGTVFKVFLGIENGSIGALKKIGKTCGNNYPEICTKAIKLLKKNGISIFAGYINFNPQSIFQELRDSGDWLYKNREAFCFTNFSQELRFYEGTKLKFKKYSINNNEYEYRFENLGIEKLYKFLFSLRVHTDSLDTKLFELSDEIYIRQIQNSKIGKEFFKIKNSVCKTNYELYLESLEYFANKKVQSIKKEEFIKKIKKYKNKLMELEKLIIN